MGGCVPRARRDVKVASELSVASQPHEERLREEGATGLASAGQAGEVNRAPRRPRRRSVASVQDGWVLAKREEREGGKRWHSLRGKKRALESFGDRVEQVVMSLDLEREAAAGHELHTEAPDAALLDDFFQQALCGQILAQLREAPRADRSFTLVSLATCVRESFRAGARGEDPMSAELYSTLEGHSFACVCALMLRLSCEVVHAVLDDGALMSEVEEAHGLYKMSGAQSARVHVLQCTKDKVNGAVRSVLDEPTRAHSVCCGAASLSDLMERENELRKQVDRLELHVRT